MEGKIGMGGPGAGPEHIMAVRKAHWHGCCTFALHRLRAACPRMRFLPPPAPRTCQPDSASSLACWASCSWACAASSCVCTTAPSCCAVASAASAAASAAVLSASSELSASNHSALDCCSDSRWLSRCCRPCAAACCCSSCEWASCSRARRSSRARLASWGWAGEGVAELSTATHASQSR